MSSEPTLNRPGLQCDFACPLDRVVRGAGCRLKFVAELVRSLRRNLRLLALTRVDDVGHVRSGRLRDDRPGLDDEHPGIRVRVGDGARVRCPRRTTSDDHDVDVFDELSRHLRSPWLLRIRS